MSSLSDSRDLARLLKAFFFTLLVLPHSGSDYVRIFTGCQHSFLFLDCLGCMLGFGNVISVCVAATTHK